MDSAENKIEKYCGNIRERIEACRTKEAALLLKKRMCRELHEHCLSEMIQNSLNYEIDRIIDTTFNTTEKNTQSNLEGNHDY